MKWISAVGGQSKLDTSTEGQSNYSIGSAWAPEDRRTCRPSVLLSFTPQLRSKTNPVSSIPPLCSVEQVNGPYTKPVKIHMEKKKKTLTAPLMEDDDELLVRGWSLCDDPPLWLSVCVCSNQIAVYYITSNLINKWSKSARSGGKHWCDGGDREQLRSLRIRRRLPDVCVRVHVRERGGGTLNYYFMYVMRGERNVLFGQKPGLTIH